ncbi:MAG: MFS transporter, partial [Pseudomonadota bacterium]
ATYYAFSNLHWSEIGYSPFIIGVLWSTGVLAEIVLLAYAKRIQRTFSAHVLIGIGGAGALVRWAATGYAPPLTALFFLQALHALTFAATFLGTIKFVEESTPPELRNTAMALASTLGVGAITGIATIIAGYIFAASGPVAAYGLMAAMGMTTVAIAGGLWVHQGRRRAV